MSIVKRSYIIMDVQYLSTIFWNKFKLLIKLLIIKNFDFKQN